MILEGVLTTLNEDGSVNIAPMGPIVDDMMTRLTLRPFQTSTTYRNLARTRQGVFHVIDDVLLVAQAVTGSLPADVPVIPASHVAGRVLSQACRWYEFDVTSCDIADERSTLEAQVVHFGRLRDVFGFNRAKHAVLEVAILATRLHILPREDVLQQLAYFESPVKKTAGQRELEAYAMLATFIREKLPSI